MVQQHFRLSAVCAGHESDVKAVLAVSDDLVVSCSRDKSVRTWTRSSPNAFVEDKTFLAHTHFVNSLAYIKPDDLHPEGLIVSGSSDKTINVFDPRSPQEPVFSLIGHTDNVCVLHVGPDGTIVSGSWDKTAKVWRNWQCAATLEGHTHAVWAVLGLSDDTVVTGSADKSIRLWKGNKCAKTFSGHADCVRALAEVKNVGILSSSNDGSLRLWSLAGDCLQELHGHTSFVYSVAVLPTGEFVSSGEDRSVRVWNDGQCVQTILQPCVSVWAVNTLACGDIIVGGSDGVVRIFTRSEARSADEDVLKTFEERVSSHAIPSNQVGDVNKDQLPGAEALSRPGMKDQQVIMVRNGNVVEAHQWSASEKQWTKVGEVVDAVGQSRKQLYEGKEYDYVFDIDISDGKPTLKLPYNVTDNPYQSAQEFIYRHELPQAYLDQIANFITKNSGGVTIGNATSAAADPYTGGSRYTPGMGVENSGIAQGNHLTGDAGTITPGASSGDPFTGSSSYRSVNQPYTMSPETNAGVVPVKAYLTFKQANLSAIRKKVLQFNEMFSNTSFALHKDEVATLDKVIRCIEAKTEADSEIWMLIEKVALSWPVENRFPGLDLARLVCLTSPPVRFGEGRSIVTGALDAIGWREGGKQFLRKETETNMMLALRTLANCFETPEGRIIMGNAAEAQAAVSFLSSAWSITTNVNIRQAIATLAVNFSVLMTDPSKADEEAALVLVSLLCELLKIETDSETIFRSMAALGTLVTALTSAKEAADLMDARETVRKQLASGEDRLKNLARELLQAALK